MARSRISTKNRQASGSGGTVVIGAAEVSIGPNFGGIDGDQFNAEGSMDLDAIALEGNLNADINTTISEVEIEYNPVIVLEGSVIVNYIADYLAYSNAVNSTTGDWTNSTNANGDTTGTSASMSATSSGLAGTVSETSTGEIRLDFNNPSSLSTSFTLDGDVNVYVETQITSAGVAPSAQVVNIQFEVSVDGGTVWNTIESNSAVKAKSIASLDITSLVGGDWTKINDLLIRGNGSISSGTGVNANITVNFYRAYLELQASL